MGDAQRGFTLVEVLAASLIASVVAGGTLMAFATAARISQQQSSTSSAEATGYAQRLLEGIHNKVTDPALGPAWLDTQAALPDPRWVSDSITEIEGTDGAGGSASIRKMSAKRCYRVTKEVGCHGTGIDCYAVNVMVCWDNLTGCLCP